MTFKKVMAIFFKGNYGHMGLFKPLIWVYLSHPNYLSGHSRTLNLGSLPRFLWPPNTIITPKVEKDR